MASDRSGDGVPQCYHWDCERDATRELVRTQDYIEPENKHVPCCDDHDPMRDPGDYLRPIDGSGQQQLITDGGQSTEEIELTERQRRRFEQVREECDAPGVPEPTDAQVVDGLLDTWDAVNRGLYAEGTDASE